MKILKALLGLLLTLALALGAMGVFADYNDDDGNGYLYLNSGYLTEGQVNIVRRARQMIEISWSPIYDRYQWGAAGLFKAGTTYTGLPYGQAVNAAYIGFDATLSDFVEATEDSGSLFYTKYSSYNKIAPYYSTDCSGFVSYCWGLEERKTTRELPQVAELVPDQSVNGLEVGDCLDDISTHVLLVTGVVHGTSGQVIAVETMEQTPVIARRMVYGQGGNQSLEYFISRYLNRGYRIYRYTERDSVQYYHDCAVPIDEDYCPNCRERAPYAATVTGTGYKTVSLGHDSGAVIYYTTDGSTPDLDSSVYDGPLTFTESTMLKAIAWTGEFDSSRVLSYYISVEACSAPVYTVKSGMSDGMALSYGSTVALSSGTYGAKIYYTTDGSEPSAGSLLYTAPISISGDTVIRAVAVADGYRDSESVSFSFTVKSFSGFTDVLPGAWYCNAVDYVYAMGLFKGTSTDKFTPDGAMTRGMFVTVLGRMAGVSADCSGEIGVVTGDDVNVRSGPGTENAKLTTAGMYDTVEILGIEDGWYQVELNGVTGYISSDYVTAYDGAFADIDMGAYYSPYVQWAYLMGISKGTGNGAFSPDAKISRQDMAVLLYNYSKAVGASLDSVNTGVSFTDDGSIASGAKDAVYALQQAGVINGMGDGSFVPGGSATRAQVAQIFMNYIM